jgi:hypothetical protein
MRNLQVDLLIAQTLQASLPELRAAVQIDSGGKKK